MLVTFQVMVFMDKLPIYCDLKTDGIFIIFVLINMCINKLKIPIITDNAEEERCWAMLADMEARLNVIEADQAKVRADQAKVRADQAKVRADQVTQAEQIAQELKYSEEDLIFMRNLNAQMEACLSH